MQGLEGNNKIWFRDDRISILPVKSEEDKNARLMKQDAREEFSFVHKKTIRLKFTRGCKRVLSSDVISLLSPSLPSRKKRNHQKSALDLAGQEGPALRQKLRSFALIFSHPTLGLIIIYCC